jgi:hypothetical protein
VLLVAAGATLVAPRSEAAPDAPMPDLRVHHAPPRLRMRAAAAPKAAASDAPGQGDAGKTPDNTPGNTIGKATGIGAGSPAAVTAFSPLPTSARELGERITFRLRAGVSLESAPASGDALRGGAALPAGFADSRPWIVGDAVVGARDLLLPSLGGYLLSSFQFDASDSRSRPAMSSGAMMIDGRRSCGCAADASSGSTAARCSRTSTASRPAIERRG